MKGEGMDKVREARWYCINRIGMATLCAGEEDARRVADRCDIDWPRCSPHRAVQLVELTAAREALSVQPAGVSIEDILAEFDKRAAPGGGFYEPQEPAEIIRAMLAGTLAEYDQSPAPQPAPSVPAVLHECLDNDSPWLICKHCGAVGKCDMAAAPHPAAKGAES